MTLEELEENLYLNSEEFEMSNWDEPQATYVTISGRHIFDGASTLADCAEFARDFANYMEQLADAGYTLEGIVDDDHGVAKLHV